MAQIYIQGFGIIGCLLAVRLEDLGVPFTWFDSDEKVQAFKASTGCCYPSGEAVDKANYERFPAEVLSHPWISKFTEVANYAFTQKSIPHDAPRSGLQVVSDFNGCKLLNKPSYHINAQEFVAQTRARFADRNSPVAPQGAFVIHAHGFHAVRPTTYRWGWHAKAKVTILEPGLILDKRTCFNLKEGRFNSSYLYPVPGSDEYYLGTHFIFQRKAKDLNMEGKAEYILNHIQKVAGSVLEVEVVPGSVVTGWRPAFEEEGPAYILEGGELFLRPQMANGWRHHLTLMDQVIPEIQRIGI